MTEEPWSPSWNGIITVQRKVVVIGKGVRAVINGSNTTYQQMQPPLTTQSRARVYCASCLATRRTVGFSSPSAIDILIPVGSTTGRSFTRSSVPERFSPAFRVALAIGRFGINTLGLNRELDSPATSHIKPGAECRSTDPCGHDNKDIGNPDGRIPEHIPEGHRDGETIAITGNPDIRVPDIVKRDDGLRTRRAFTTKDAEEGDAEVGGRKETSPERTPKEEQTNAGPGDTITGQDVPKSSNAATSPEGRGSVRYGPV
ncbi:hypothetical protein NDU88_006480 [Pleurodeles waltl]|uniref:Uncharacterized protein n=1 Tax=Pleurodeles waltl TaxID=8319 RepID=A0AAV7LSP7_PLEWA|nr:hypothetical protein NDU88_006480 [Pleurodeles waltl]